MQKRRYKLRYCIGRREIELEWEREKEINKNKRAITRYIERYKLTENEERIIRVLCDGKAHFEGEIAESIYGKKSETSKSRVAVEVYEINKKIKGSTLNRGIDERKRAKVIERISYSRYRIASEIEVEN